ncbi:MAG: DNA-processing protein DprA [Lachnospiraceae bacterium]|nr:DNA-processing protein DprA [Lachnospiraceae bacterium]
MKEINKERDILNLWFNNIEGIGAILRRKLMTKFGSIENILSASSILLEEIVGANKAVQITASHNMSYAHELYEELKEKKISIVYPGAEDYPVKLLNMFDPPDILYVKGILSKKLNIYNMNIGVVGARNASVYGRELASFFGRELAKEGINIISGLALGIDGMSHRGALYAGGYTVGVLGCGIDVIYPRENAELFFEMYKNGAVISEYGPGVIPNPGFFPIRNRIISGLSDGLLVVEARKKSGSLITADLALEQGKQVYAIPGRITDKSSEGTNNLIRQGAMCVVSPKEIIEDLNGIVTEEKYKSGNKELKSGNNKLYNDNVDLADEFKENIEVLNKNSLAPAEKMLYSCLSLEPTYIDDIIDKLRMSVSDTISLLYNMEEKGLIKQPLKGYYIISV